MPSNQTALTSDQLHLLQLVELSLFNAYQPRSFPHSTRNPETSLQQQNRNNQTFALIWYRFAVYASYSQNHIKRHFPNDLPFEKIAGMAGRRDDFTTNTAETIESAAETPLLDETENSLEQMFKQERINLILKALIKELHPSYSLPTSLDIRPITPTQWYEARMNNRQTPAMLLRCFLLITTCLFLYAMNHNLTTIPDVFMIPIIALKLLIVLIGLPSSGSQMDLIERELSSDAGLSYANPALAWSGAFKAISNYSKSPHAAEHKKANQAGLFTATGELMQCAELLAKENFTARLSMNP